MWLRQCSKKHSLASIEAALHCFAISHHEVDLAVFPALSKAVADLSPSCSVTDIETHGQQ